MRLTFLLGEMLRPGLTDAGASELAGAPSGPPGRTRILVGTPYLESERAPSKP